MNVEERQPRKRAANATTGNDEPDHDTNVRTE